MSNAEPGKSGTDQWRVLLDETRLALSTLRAEDLEELAERAQCMLSATVGNDSIRQRIPSPRDQDLLELTKEQYLFSNLLVATRRNLEVLCWLRGHGRAGGGEANSRWVR